MDDISNEKQTTIIKQFKDNSNNKVVVGNMPDQAQNLAKRIQAGFNKEEAV